MRILFKGPEGSKFEGLDLVGVKPDRAKIRDMAAVQTATGLKLADLASALGTNETLGTQAVIFFTLRNAGMFVKWDEAGDFAISDLEIVEEPGDRGDVEDEEADPTTALTDSAQGDVDATEKTAPRKAASRGSRTLSGPAS